MSETHQPAQSSSSEFRIQIDRGGAPANGGAKLSSAKKQNEAIAEQIRAKRAAIHQQHLIDQQSMAQAKEAEAAAVQNDPPPEREDIESIEFDSVNGMTIVYGPPRNISLADRIARLYGGRDPSMSEFRLTRILMGVRSIDGVPVPPISNEIDRTALANRIGDETIDLLMYYDRTHFPALRQSEIPVVRKIFRKQ